MAGAPRVFLSYSHDSDEHAARVLDLANALRRDGCDVTLDRYVHPAPDEGWPLWMDRKIRDAGFVLMICTATYLRRVMGEEEAGQGLGVRWEGMLIYNRIYHDRPSGSRFIPILLSGAEPAHIPTPVLGHNRYVIATFSHSDRGYDGLCRHLRSTPEVIAPPIGALGDPVVWNVPYPRNLDFTGREAVLAQLEAALDSGPPAALPQAIAGLGGGGKTQTAVEYAYRYREQYHAVLWVRAGTEADLASGSRELAEVLGLPEKDESDSTKVAAAVRRWLGREPGYLLILDNADDPALVKPFLPPSPTGHILLTSRAQNFDQLNIRRPIALPLLEPDEALAFLGKRTGREGPLDPAEQAAARTLAGELGYLPLALEQAAAYMKEHEERFSVYLDAYRVERLKLLDEMGPVTGEYTETIRTTWKRSFEAVAAASRAASALLRLSAFFAPDAIPCELILEGGHELGKHLASALASPPGGEHALNTLLTPLARHSLVRRDPAARTYSVHRLVQAVLLDELTAATRKDLAERAVKALDRAFSDVHYEIWPRCERLVPHAVAAWGWIESEGLRVPEASRLLNQAGFYLQHRGRYAEAEPLYHRALALRERALGPDDPTTAHSLNNLAVLLAHRGQYAAAEPLLRRRWRSMKRRWGPSTRTSLQTSTTWRGSTASRGSTRPPSRYCAGRWRSMKRRLGPRPWTSLQTSTTWRCCTLPRGSTRPPSRSIAGRWRFASGRWAPITPRRPKPSTTWRCCTLPRGSTRPPSRSIAGRWRFASGCRAPTPPTRPKPSTTWRSCILPRGSTRPPSRSIAGRWRFASGLPPITPRRPKPSTTWRSCTLPRGSTRPPSRSIAAPWQSSRRHSAQSTPGPPPAELTLPRSCLGRIGEGRGRPGRRSNGRGRDE